MGMMHHIYYFTHAVINNFNSFSIGCSLRIWALDAQGQITSMVSWQQVKDNVTYKF